MSLYLSPEQAHKLNSIAAALSVSPQDLLDRWIRVATTPAPATPAMPDQALEPYFRTLVQSMDDVVFTLDTATRHTGMYGRWMEHSGLTSAMFEGKTATEIMGEEAGRIHEEQAQEALQGQTVVYQWETDGRRYQTRLSPIYDAEGAVVGLVGIGRDITEHQQLIEQQLYNETLEALLDKERELVELKERLIAMMSHEFRTPLAVIQASTDILTRHLDKLNPERVKHRLQQISHQVFNITRLLDDMVMLTRYNRGSMPFKPQLTEIVAFLHNLILDLQVADHNQHPIDLTTGDVPEYLLIDRYLFERIVINLLTNAIKFSPPEHPVTCDLAVEGQMLVLTIADQGMGIAPEEQERVFDLFHRGENSHQVTGSGLGLAIVKQSVETHGGTIHLRSALHQGATFTVRLPLRQLE